MLLLIVVTIGLDLTSAQPCSGLESPSFEWPDYIVLGSMLVVSCGIGYFYSLSSDKQKNREKSVITSKSDDYYCAGGEMGTIPMAMSLAAGFVTAIELLGNPSEMYTYGTQFWMTCVAFVVVIPITSYLYLPVYMNLGLTSLYEYLEKRFNQTIRVIGATLYTLQMVLYTSVAVYAPALALSHVTQMNTHFAVTLVYVVCIFYASQGGMKAVIMTDTFQAAILILSIITVLVLGHNYTDDLDSIINVNFRSGRIEVFETNFDPRVRHSIWSVVIGGTVYWTTMFCSNQATIQKYMSVKTISQARKAVWVSSISLIMVFSINFYTGMIMYAKYSNCDPLLAKAITASDQMLPYFVMDTLGGLKGVPGLFVAGIFAASLGTVASAINSMAAVAVQDILKGVCGKSNIDPCTSRWISAGFGILSFLLVFVVEQLGSLLQVALSFNGMAGGVTLGLITLGIFYPWANSKGALIGSSVAMILIAWIGVGAQLAQTKGYQPAPPKPTSLDGCVCINDSYIPTPTSLPHNEVFVLYQISYLWYSVIGSAVTIVVGLFCSLVCGSKDQKLDIDLLSPQVLTMYRKLGIKLPSNIKSAT